MANQFYVHPENSNSIAMFDSTNIKYQVYKTTNKINGIFYIGVHACSCKDCKYLGSGREIRKAIKEYGKQNFKKEILFELSNSHEMYNKENELVNDEFRKRNDTYNISIGGCGLNQKGLVPVRDKNGNTFSVFCDDEKFKSGELTSIKKNKVTVTDGIKIFDVDIFDKRYVEGSLVSIQKGKITVIDKNNKTFKINKDDYRFLSGELKSINKNKVVVKNLISDLCEQVNKDDKRLLNGELQYLTKGKVTVKNKLTNKFEHTNVDDERIKNGVLIHLTSGYTSIRNKKTKEIEFVSKEEAKQKTLDDWEHVNANKVMAKDKDGVIFSVNKNDERLKNGTLINIRLGKRKVMDKNNNKFFVDKEDPRLITGELICTNRLYRKDYKKK